MRARFVAALVAVLAMLLVVPAGWAHKGHGGGKGPRAVDLDVLFVGAHPDDEAFILATLGQWGEAYGLDAGVVTITRGEGGGNAQGPEEGPAARADPRGRGAARRRQGRHRERLLPRQGRLLVHAQRAADGADLGPRRHPRAPRPRHPHDAPRGRLHDGSVAEQRTATTRRPRGSRSRPTPRPRIPNAFPEQLREEGLKPWRVQKIFRVGASGTTAPPTTPDGSDCPNTFTPDEPTDIVYGVWTGTPSAALGHHVGAGRPRRAAEYLTQGWGAFPPTVSAPFDCDSMTLIDSRVPFELEGTTPVPQTHRTPRPRRCRARSSSRSTASRWASSSTSPSSRSTPSRAAVRGHRARPQPKRRQGPAPRGSRCSSRPAGGHRRQRPPRRRRVARRHDDVHRAVPADAAESTRFLLGGTLSGQRGERDHLRGGSRRAGRRGHARSGCPTSASSRRGRAAPACRSSSASSRPSCRSARARRATLSVTLTNHTGCRGVRHGRAGEPAGRRHGDARLASRTPSPPTASRPSVHASRGGERHDEHRGAVRHPDHELDRPEQRGCRDRPCSCADGHDPAGGHRPGRGRRGLAGRVRRRPTPIDIGKLWEGDPSTWSGRPTGRATPACRVDGDALYFLVQVTDDVLGTKVAQADCKRHWRSDSIEIALDPRGSATTRPPCSRRASSRPRSRAARAPSATPTTGRARRPPRRPGMQVASTVSDPYAGYVLEVKIDAGRPAVRRRPGPPRAERHRLRLRHAGPDGAEPLRVAERRPGAGGAVPLGPRDAARLHAAGRSPDGAEGADDPDRRRPQRTSPQSILQSATNGVPLAGLPAVPRRQGASLETPACPAAASRRSSGRRRRAPPRCSRGIPDWAAAYAGAVTAPHRR